MAIEDERFYKHKGVDYSAIVRAAVKNLESSKTVQGGSTITMQLIRNLYIKDPERDLPRKIREAKLAYELENEAFQDLDPRQLPQHGLFGTVGGQTAIGVGPRAVLLQQAREEPQAARVGDARRAAAGALAVQPGAATRGRASHAATRCWRKMAENGFITPAEAAEAMAADDSTWNTSRYITAAASRTSSTTSRS